MKGTEKDALDLLKAIMRRCKNERKAKTQLTNKQLAARLGITENYLSAFENGRAVPSLPVFFLYLLLSGFDMSALLDLEITEKELIKPLSQTKAELLQKIYEYDEGQAGYLLEQAKISELFDLKIRKPN